MDETLMPVVGNLAWAPFAETERVEILDRFNGVPTLGVLKIRDTNHLFWRVVGYVSSFSLWLYVPLDKADCGHLDDCDAGELLNGVILQSARERYVTVGMADGNRLFFEREWLLPAHADEETLTDELYPYLIEALQVARDQDLPASRREIVDRASRAMHDLVLHGTA